MTDNPKYKRIFITRPSTIQLDGVAGVLMDILSSIEVEKGQSFSLCGGFVRNSLLGRPYNDFDISSPAIHVYREVMHRMGVLEFPAEEEYRDGVTPHDRFIDPYDLTGKKYPIHWIDHFDLNGYPPQTFDFGINEFALKSDGRLHAPTFAWRQFKNKVIRANPNNNVTTNVIMRAIRFSALSGFTIDPETLKRFEDRFDDPLDEFRVYAGTVKMFEDGVAERCFEIMEEIGFREIDAHENLKGLQELALARVRSGNFIRDHGGDYHDFNTVPVPRRERQQAARTVPATEDEWLPF